jgi:hypothetical protein
MKTSRAFLLFLALAMLSLSCGDDSTTPAPNTPAFQDLSQKNHVLNNFELAHNKRDASHYTALLDDNFTFFYTEGDVGGSGTPVQWGRSEDVPITSALFASVDKLDFDLSDPNGITWDTLPAPGGTEDWQITTVYYKYTIKIDDTTYIPNSGAKMSLTVRNAGTEEAPQWKLVELHDLGGPSLRASARRSAVTEPTTYGRVKALFR